MHDVASYEATVETCGLSARTCRRESNVLFVEGLSERWWTIQQQPFIARTSQQHRRVVASSNKKWQRAVVFFVRVDLFAGCLFCDGCLTWVWRRKYWRRMVEDGGLRQKGEGREKEMVMALENRWKHRVLLCYLYMDSSVRFFNWFQLFNLTKPKIEIINNQ